jgi:SDR family mycofactocin-dependent oxidoreductase
MGGRLEGKVALVTGAARGQGKSHCIRLAEEGADIIAIDILEQMSTVRYPMGSAADMADTVASVEALDRRIIDIKGDVRSRDQMAAAVARGLAEFGHLDIVSANAGILPVKEHTVQSFFDAFDVDFGGVMNICAVTVPHLTAGASIILTGSTAGMMPKTLTNPIMGPGSVGYGLAKTFIIQYCETLALQLAPLSIRVNALHPTNVNTNLINNEDMYKVFRPDLENPTQEDALPAYQTFQALPIPFVEPRDISNALLFLASDEARYITGINMRVDAGSLIKWPDGPS